MREARMNFASGNSGLHLLSIIHVSNNEASKVMQSGLGAASSCALPWSNRSAEDLSYLSGKSRNG